MADTQGNAGPLTPGTTLQNRYFIERLLGGGGMGVVYLARDQRLANRPCAIKEMVDHFIDQAQRIEANEYFAREADTLAQLKHQAIPSITDRFDDKNRHYLVMEYVEGRNLEEEITATGQALSESLVIDVARQLCDVLAYLHGLVPPIIYRDMKPSNVMLTPKGRVVLVDFGIARLFKAARKGTMIGTLGFAPPEQYQGTVDPRSDIYSLGATLHFVLTNRDPEKFPPFSFPKIKELMPNVSDNLAGAIDAALAYDVNRRPATIQEFRDMMLYGRGLEHTGGLHVSATGGTGGLSFSDEIHDDMEYVRPKPRRSGRRAVALITFSIFLAGLAFGATYIYSNPELQSQLGLKPLIDNLPWKHEELVNQAREHPLEFQQMTLALSTRDGTAISAPQSSFSDIDLTNAHYLKWTANFKNGLAGLEGRDEKVEAKFYSPSGGDPITTSSQQSYVGPSDKTVEFSGVALMPTMTGKPPGAYKVALYADNQPLAEQAFIVTQDLSAKAKVDAAEKEADDAIKAEERKRAEEAKQLAMIEKRRAKPLALREISFRNTTKTGTPLSNASSSFDISKVLFIGWQVSFDNELYKLESSQYRLDAAYIAPDGSTLGAVNDFQQVSPNQKTVTFSGRVGNSKGGAFLPGTYTVNFYLNGQYFAEKKFNVADNGAATYSSGGGSPGYGGGSSYGGGSGYSGGSSGGGFPSGGYASSGGSASGFGASGGTVDPGMLGPMLANGSISGLSGGGNAQLELRLRPQPNGFLHGELVIHKPGFGLTPIEGYVRGNHLQFQVPYGTETYYFEGARSSDTLAGKFESTPSGTHGTWTAQAN
ncbi:MAG TPA: protein kinase [Candidatus Binataceae bacterium]|nr:protein kinase [Candidatus Binataceae bacterium]